MQVQNKLTTIEEAAKLVKDGMDVMIGGFLANGTPESLIDELVKLNVKDLTIIANDSGFPDRGIGKLVVNKSCKKVVASHIGTNPEMGRQMTALETEVILVPQGTLAEQIRAAGAGLGGVLTPTGLGTVVEEGKEKISVDGKVFLLEKPIRAHVAILKGSVVDKKGNIFYTKTTRNFNTLMAMAADLVIVEADKIVEVGELDPDLVMTPGIFVDIIVKGVK